MATYIVGDVHGCFRTLERLLLAIPFESGRDRLWLTGDLVNRGPSSLEVLRWARAASLALGDRFVAVLGNHDLHLLSTAAGRGRPHHRAAFERVLEAPDRDALIQWLAHRPLFHRQGSVALVHAGLFPAWSLEEAASRARAVEIVLRDDARRKKLLDSIADSAKVPRDLYAFTSLRLIDPKGEPCDFTGPPDQAPPGCLPWFSLAGRASRKATLVAGHWAALGLHVAEGFLGLDTGCVYGGALTAVRLEDMEMFSAPNSETGSSPELAS
ncbi:MAG: symmetrical bis(5'-nucleosyl)-tetraphosphatase [bacterium]|nr:symmetrical bis(5'-nucleosyl)-tetraphosphatase [bacterium]